MNPASYTVSEKSKVTTLLTLAIGLRWVEQIAINLRSEYSNGKKMTIITTMKFSQ